MNLQELIHIVSLLSIEQKQELIAFVRTQSTDDLEMALEQIVAKMESMGLMINSATTLQNARDRIAALEALSSIL